MRLSTKIYMTVTATGGRHPKTRRLRERIIEAAVEVFAESGYRAQGSSGMAALRAIVDIIEQDRRDPGVPPAARMRPWRQTRSTLPTSTTKTATATFADSLRIGFSFLRRRGRIKSPLAAGQSGASLAALPPPEDGPRTPPPTAFRIPARRESDRYREGGESGDDKTVQSFRGHHRRHLGGLLRKCPPGQQVIGPLSGGVGASGRFRTVFGSFVARGTKIMTHSQFSSRGVRRRRFPGAGVTLARSSSGRRPYCCTRYL